MASCPRRNLELQVKHDTENRSSLQGTEDGGTVAGECDLGLTLAGQVRPGPDTNFRGMFASGP